MGLLIARSGQTPWLLHRCLPCSCLSSPALPLPPDLRWLLSVGGPVRTAWEWPRAISPGIPALRGKRKRLRARPIAAWRQRSGLGACFFPFTAPRLLRCGRLMNLRLSLPGHTPLLLPRTRHTPLLLLGPALSSACLFVHQPRPLRSSSDLSVSFFQSLVPSFSVYRSCTALNLRPLLCFLSTNTHHFLPLFISHPTTSVPPLFWSQIGTAYASIASFFWCRAVYLVPCVAITQGYRRRS